MSPTKIEIVATTALLFLLSAGVIWIRTANIQATYEFNEKERKLTSLKTDEQSLRIRLTKLSSPRRLKEMSKELNLAAPKISQLYRFKDHQ